MSLTINENVYGLTESGKKIKIGTAAVMRDDIYITGGKIFYIDETSTGATYHFYNQDGTEVDNPAIGDSPYAYTVTGTPSKDKYYIANPTRVCTSKVFRDGTSDELVDIFSNTSGDIGTGKGNTIAAIAASLAQSDTTIWYYLNQFNSTGDCTDWYIPSKTELLTLATAVDGGGNKIVPANLNCWSSTEYPYGNTATTKTSWLFKNGSLDREYYVNKYSAYAIRSF